MRRASIFLMAFACFPVSGLATDAAPVKKFELGACTIPGLPPDARCGTYEVWENRAAKSGRRIPLRVVVIPATGPDRLPDPFVYFNGGPGDPSVSAAPWIVQDFAALRKRRDLLFVDFRGTSGPEGLFCPELEGNLQGFLDQYMPPDRVKACAERLSKTADLTQYTSDNSIDDVDEVRAALGYEKLNLLGGTFLGDLRIRALRAACAAWPVPPVRPEFRKPVASGVPVLLLSGERDPVTPSSNAERAARTLPNSLHVVTPDGGHSDSGIEGAFECAIGLITRLVETGTLEGLDTSCIARTKRPEFVLKLDPDVELPPDQLARLAGTYKDPESGYEIRIETVGRQLRVREGEYPPTMLVAASPTRFRMEGTPPSSFHEFQVTDGRATALRIVNAGLPPQTLKRRP